MKRKKFLKSSLTGLGALVGLPVALSSLAKTKDFTEEACSLSPRETAGPFPIKTPSDLVRANIISDRAGVPLLMTLSVLNKNNYCQPMPDVLVDVWHCDSHGYYSEYGGHRWQEEDFTKHHFLRGRQTTDKQGQASFISIYPGWYPGRAPHVHVEVLDKNERSLLITQIAFPDDISEEVYRSESYKGSADTDNDADGIFANSLDGNIGSISGNIRDGYILTHKIIVAG